MEVWQAIALGAVFVAAGSVKGITGMGLPTVAMSLLGLWMTPTQAAALLIVPSLATNVAQCAGPHLRRLAALLWPAWAALALITLVAPGLGTAASGSGARRLLGAVLVAYGLWGLWRPVVPALRPKAGWVGAVAGAVTGLVTAATAVFVIPFVPYLQALRLDKDTMVQALGLSFTIATVALAARLHAADQPWQPAPTALALLAAFAGLWLGSQIRARISAIVFQRTLFVVFIGLGVANLLRGG
jgi:uncharacterized membrane protein YfcA